MPPYANDYRHILMMQMRGMKKEYKSNGVMHVLEGKPDDWPDALALACKGMKSGSGIRAFAARGLDPDHTPEPEPETVPNQPQSVDDRIESVMDDQSYWDNL